MEQNPGKKYGTLAGIAIIIYFLLFYVVNKSAIMGTGVSWSSILIQVAAVFYAVKVFRDSKGGSFAFKEGLKTGFLVIVISNILFYLFFYLLLTYDPTLVQILKEQGIAFSKDWLPEDQWPEIDKAYENFTFGLSDVLMYFAKSTIGGFFIALLAALLLKRA